MVGRVENQGGYAGWGGGGEVFLFAKRNRPKGKKSFSLFYYFDINMIPFYSGLQLYKQVRICTASDAYYFHMLLLQKIRVIQHNLGQRFFHFSTVHMWNSNGILLGKDVGQKYF